MGHQRDRGTKTRLLEANKRAAEFYAAQLRTPEARARDGVPHRARLRRGSGRALRLRLRPRGLGRAHQAPARGRASPSTSWRRPGSPGRATAARWTASTAGCCGRSATAAARSSASARGASTTTTASRPSTSTPPRRRSTARRTCCSGSTWPSREIVKRRQVVVVEGYTDVMAMHLAGVPTAVASCGTAFGAEHIGGDPKAHRRRLVRPRRGHLHLRRRRGGPGRRAQGVRGRAGVRHPDLRHDRARRAGPLRAAADPGRRRRARPRGPPRADLRVRDPLACCASSTSTPPRAGSPRCSARCRWSPGSSARSCATSTPAASRAGSAGTTSRWSCGGCGRRRARPSSRAGAVRSSAPPKDDPRLHVQREALKAALQVPGIAGPSYDELPEQAFTHPALAAVHRAVQAAGGVGAGHVRPAVGGGRRGRVHGRRPGGGVGAGRRADGAAAAHALALGDATRPATWRASSPGCGSRWWRRRWRS